MLAESNCIATRNGAYFPMPKPRVAVVGSLNIDHFTRVASFPAPGETVLAREHVIRFGGKGANQAVAAARLGAEVSMIGSLGSDEMGARYRQRMEEEGIDMSGVESINDVSSGCAFINLNDSGENTIVVAPAANGCTGPQSIRKHERRIAESDCLLIQNELPSPATSTAVEIAGSHAVPVIYNTAPWDPTRDSELRNADLLVLNESEKRGLAESGASPGNHIVTRGAEPTLAVTGEDSFLTPTFEVTPVDTVGAGDTFVGAIAASFSAEGITPESIRFANAAAAMATLGLGAQESMPTRAEVDEFSCRPRRSQTGA